MRLFWSYFQTLCYPAIKIVEYLTTAMWSHTPWQCGIGRSHQSRIVITVRYLRRGTSLLTFQIPVIDRIKRTVIVVGMQFRKAWGVWSSCWAVKIVGTSGTKHHVLLSSLRRRLKIPKSGNISIQEGLSKKNLNCKLPWGLHFVVAKIEAHNCRLWPCPGKIEFVVVVQLGFWARVGSNAVGLKL